MEIPSYTSEYINTTGDVCTLCIIHATYKYYYESFNRKHQKNKKWYKRPLPESLWKELIDILYMHSKLCDGKEFNITEVTKHIINNSKNISITDCSLKTARHIYLGL